jgi:mannose-6-phosphate isomerase-like protein (cupin superfamily)
LSLETFCGWFRAAAVGSLSSVGGNLVLEDLIRRQKGSKEFATAERCHIIETYNSAADESLSIARARVEPNVITAWHCVEGTVERYIIAQGRGRVEVGDWPAAEVGPGDVVVIPVGTRQRIANVGTVDLIFYCVCTPRFRSLNYQALE